MAIGTYLGIYYYEVPCCEHYLLNLSWLTDFSRVGN